MMQTDWKTLAATASELLSAKELDVAAAVKLVVPLIDHTILRPEATDKDIRAHCEEALRYPFAGVCVFSHWVPLAAGVVKGTGLQLASVAGFPAGCVAIGIKIQEAMWAVDHGATEIDMVANYATIRSGDWSVVEYGVPLIVTSSSPAKVKFILESSTLSDDEIVKMCELCASNGAGFVKTSTGFHPSGGATEAAVRLMRKTVGDRCGVKASGGVRDITTALKMIAAGANRIGTSSGVAIAKLA